MTTQQCEECFELFATATEYLNHKYNNHPNDNFMDTLNKEVVKLVNEKIKEDLFEDWSFALDNNDIFYGDKEYAERSGNQYVINKFNSFYKLDPTDTDFLTA